MDTLNEFDKQKRVLSILNVTKWCHGSRISGNKFYLRKIINERYLWNPTHGRGLSISPVTQNFVENTHLSNSLLQSYPISYPQGWLSAKA